MIQLRAWQAEQLDPSLAVVPKRAIFAAPRLGKTLTGTRWLKENFFNQPSFVVAPIRVCSDWVIALKAEGLTTIDAFTPSLENCRAIIKASQNCVIVTNWEHLSSLEVRRSVEGQTEKKTFTYAGLADLLSRCEAGIFDESHFVMNSSADRSKSYRKIAKAVPNIRILTGTPAPNHFGNLWGQLQPLDPDNWEGSYEQFARKFLIRNSLYPTKVEGYREENIEELRARLLSISSIVRREDVFGPDTYQYVVRELDFPDKVRKQYETLVHDWLISLEDGSVVDGAHHLTRMTRLQQLTSGFLVNDEGRTTWVHKAKVERVAADLTEIIASREKAVLFHKFRPEAEIYADLCAKMKIPFVTLNGDSSVAEGQSAMQTFREFGRGMVAVVQIKSGGTGTSFATATHALRVSRDFSFVADEQARDRIYEPGKVRCITDYRIAGTIDGLIDKKLAAKQDVHRAVTRADIEAMAYGASNRAN